MRIADLVKVTGLSKNQVESMLNHDDFITIDLTER